VLAGGLLTLAVAGIGLWHDVDFGGAAPLAERARITEAAATVRQAIPVPARAKGTDGAGQDPTIFLVGSQEQADAVRAALDQRDEILTQQGQALPTDEILVVGSAEEEFRVRASIHESDTIRAALQLPPATVVDLRGR
jgi:hypothetical protein